MHRYHGATVVGALLLAAVVGGFAYNAGVAHGIQQSGKMLPVPYPYPYFPFFSPFFFLLFGFFALRLLFWRGHHHWHRHDCERMKDA